MSKEDILSSTNKDPTFTKLAAMISISKFVKTETAVKKFSKVFDKLSVSPDGLIIKDGYQIVIPMELQDKIFKIAHQGHLGITKTKQLLRSKVWFPGLNDKVEREIKTCLPCQSVVNSGTVMTPIVMS